MGQTAELDSAELDSAELKKTCNTDGFADAYVNMINFIYAFSSALVTDRRLTQRRSLGALHAYTSREEQLSRSKYNQPNLTGSNAVLYMSRTQLIEFGSCEVRRLNWALLYRHPKPAAAWNNLQRQAKESYFLASFKKNLTVI